MIRTAVNEFMCWQHAKINTPNTPTPPIFSGGYKKVQIEKVAKNDLGPYYPRKARQGFQVRSGGYLFRVFILACCQHINSLTAVLILNRCPYH